MSTIRRHHANKRAVAKKHARGSHKTHVRNMQIMRGGWRL